MSETLQQFQLDSSLIETCFLEAENGLKNGEVPVGCVFILEKDGRHEVIAKAYNRTNEFLSALKHAEMICVSQVVSQFPDSHKSVLKQVIALITLEPCIMCCRMLRMLEIRAILYGAKNDRFGGAGSVYGVDTDERIECRPLTCIAALNANRAIGLLQKFYEQTNDNVPKNRTVPLNK